MYTLIFIYIYIYTYTQMLYIKKYIIFIKIENYDIMKKNNWYLLCFRCAN